jgi:hypothetical protein
MNERHMIVAARCSLYVVKKSWRNDWMVINVGTGIAQSSWIKQSIAMEVAKDLNKARR